MMIKTIHNVAFKPPPEIWVTFWFKFPSNSSAIESVTQDNSSKCNTRNSCCTYFHYYKCRNSRRVVIGRQHINKNKNWFIKSLKKSSARKVTSGLCLLFFENVHFSECYPVLIEELLFIYVSRIQFNSFILKSALSAWGADRTDRYNHSWFWQT